MPPCAAGNAIVDGVAASNFIVQEHSRLVLDASMSERVKFQACPPRKPARPCAARHRPAYVL